MSKNQFFSLRQALIRFLEDEEMIQYPFYIEFEVLSLTPLRLARENYTWHFPNLIQSIEKDKDYLYICDILKGSNKRLSCQISNWGLDLRKSDDNQTITPDIVYSSLSFIQLPPEAENFQHYQEYPSINEDPEISTLIQKRSLQATSRVQEEPAKDQMTLSSSQNSRLDSLDSILLSSLKGKSPVKSRFFSNNPKLLNFNSPHFDSNQNRSTDYGLIFSPVNFGPDSNYFVRNEPSKGPEPEIILVNNNFNPAKEAGVLSSNQKLEEEPVPKSNQRGQENNFQNREENGQIGDASHNDPLHDNNFPGFLKQEPISQLLNFKTVPEENNIKRESILLEPAQQALPSVKKFGSNLIVVDENSDTNENDAHFIKQQADIVPFEAQVLVIDDQSKKKQTSKKRQSHEYLLEENSVDQSDYLTFGELMSGIMHGYIKWEDVHFSGEVVRMALDKLAARENRT